MSEKQTPLKNKGEFKMYIEKQVSFEELYRDSWSGAVGTLETIKEHGKEQELLDFLPELFNGVPSETDVNDVLWHESELIFETLGIEEEY